MSAKEVLCQFSTAQQIRTARYRQLEEGFEAVLHSQNEAEYKYAAKLIDTWNAAGHTPFLTLLLLAGQSWQRSQLLFKSAQRT